MSIAMNMALIERASAAVQSHFRISQDTYMAYLNMSLDSPEFGTERGLLEFSNKLKHLPTVRFSSLMEDFDALQNSAISDADMELRDMDQTVRKMLQARATQCWDDLRAQEQRERAAVVNHYRNLALRVRRMRVAGDSLTSAVVTLRRPFNKRVLYEFTDRSGRSWRSLSYVRATVRWAMISNYNETMLFMLAKAGDELAVIHHVDSSHPSHGMVISVSGKILGITEYETIKKEKFHPNSRALIARKPAV